MRISPYESDRGKTLFALYTAHESHSTLCNGGRRPSRVLVFYTRRSPSGGRMCAQTRRKINDFRGRPIGFYDARPSAKRWRKNHTTRVPPTSRTCLSVDFLILVFFPSTIPREFFWKVASLHVACVSRVRSCVHVGEKCYALPPDSRVITAHERSTGAACVLLTRKSF